MLALTLHPVPARLPTAICEAVRPSKIYNIEVKFYSCARPRAAETEEFWAFDNPSSQLLIPQRLFPSPSTVQRQGVRRPPPPVKRAVVFADTGTRGITAPVPGLLTIRSDSISQ